MHPGCRMEIVEEGEWPVGIDSDQVEQFAFSPHGVSSFFDRIRSHLLALFNTGSQGGISILT